MNLRGMSCIFPVPDIRKTAQYYTDCLGFSAVPWLDCAEPHICLYREGTEIILLQADRDRVLPNRELYGYGFDAYLYAEDQEILEQEFTAKGVNIVRPLDMTDYQNREFVVEDIDGRWLAFGLKQKGAQ